MRGNNRVDNKNKAETPARHEDEVPPPVYQKPVLRKYDQIEQVKPYGPSELEAG